MPTANLFYGVSVCEVQNCCFSVPTQKSHSDSFRWRILLLFYSREKLPLSQNLRLCRGSRFSQCFILSTALKCSLPLVSSTFKWVQTKMGDKIRNKFTRVEKLGRWRYQYLSCGFEVRRNYDTAADEVWNAIGWLENTYFTHPWLGERSVVCIIIL